MAKTKWEKVKLMVRLFFTESTFHGMPQIVLAPMLWQKVTWVILVIIASVVACFELVTIITYFASKPLEIESKVRRFCACVYTRVWGREGERTGEGEAEDF